MEDEVEDQHISATPFKVRHIKKRSLKNKSLSITFDEQDLRNYVTGFQKRKKKRRKEALKQQEEAKRQKRIEARKKRKQEREYVMFGGAPAAADSTADGSDGCDEEGDDGEQVPSVSGTTTYNNGDLKVTVTTREICRDNEEQPEPIAANRKHSVPVPVAKKKPFKRVARHRSRSKSKDNKKGKRKGKGR